MTRETLAAKRVRAAEILRRLRNTYPGSRISLTYANDFQLLVAVVLSAQCTDAMVNRVTPALFARYPNAEAFARAKLHELEGLIRRTGYFRQKARHIRGAARVVTERFGSVVPSTMHDLLTLPGVGRKTANVLLWSGHGKSEGIAVDTHVARISQLLRLSRRPDPTRIERDLMRVLPRSAWGDVTHLMIDHGRATCIARRPKCSRCVLSDLCPSSTAEPRTDNARHETGARRP